MSNDINKMAEDAEMVYGKEEMLPRVTAIEEIRGHRLLLRFNNGELREFDAGYLLDMPIYKKHNLEKTFRQARVELDTVVWPGDIDIAPETLYIQSIPVYNER